jgi:DNA processing protein
MSLDDDRLDRVRLAAEVDAGEAWVARLVQAGGARRAREQVRQVKHDRLLRREPGTDLDERRHPVDPERVLADAERRGIRFVIPGDEEWPGSLDDLAWAEPLHERGGVPLGLWVRGPVRLTELAGSVAVVGSRSATTYGGDAALDIAQTIAGAGRAVVSGAAFGIDRAAHRGALIADGTTVAVLACGADRAYPKAHEQLVDHLAHHGAVVSEALPGWAPTRIRFLARNRLIAALTAGTVVVEAAIRSGALNTASWASRLNRPLMGVPGPVTSAPSQGVHQLIRSGAATLVTNGPEVLEEVSAVGEYLLDLPRGPVRRRDRLDGRQRAVVESVPLVRPAPVASIARTAQLSDAEAREALRELAALGLVEETAGGWSLTSAAAEEGAG